jgi:signal transduction histidine kinase
VRGEHRERALDPFWRAPDAAKGGTGPGLSLVRKPAEVGGGTAALRHCGTAAPRHCGTAAPRHRGTAAPRPAAGGRRPAADGTGMDAVVTLPAEPIMV